MKLVEIKIIVTSIIHLMNPFRKKDPFHAYKLGLGSTYVRP
jgi:hypothetical protein